MKEWLIDTGSKRNIKVIGKTLEQAVKDYGRNHPRKQIICGLLVKVRYKGITTYWSGEKFLECLG